MISLLRDKIRIILIILVAIYKKLFINWTIATYGNTSTVISNKLKRTIFNFRLIYYISSLISTLNKILKLIFLFQVISAIGSVHAAQDSASKSKPLDSLHKVFVANKNQRIKIENELQEKYLHSGDREWRAFAELLKFTRLKSNNEKLVEKFASEVSMKYKSFPNVQARAYQTLAYHYFIGDANYEKAFHFYLELEKLLEMHGPDLITDYANYCGEIASAYYKFKNYDKAIELAKKGLPYALDKWDFYNTIGLCYERLTKLDSSSYYLKKAVTEAITRKKPDIYRTISLGNIGYGYYLQKKNTSAKPLLKADFDGAIRIDDKGLAVGAAIPLADIYLGEGKWSIADSLLKLARVYINHSQQLERLEKFYPIRSKYYQYLGKEKLALLYRDSTIWAIKRNDSIFNSLLVMRVQQRTDMAKLAEEKSKLENYQKISRIRLWAIAIIFILIASGLFIVRRYRSRLEKERKHIEELNRILALRQRLSADMHDDVGSTLSSISLYTHSLLMLPQNEKNRNILEKIKQNAQNAQECMGDIIWSVNPDMDVMEQVVARMRSLGADLTEHANIAFTFIETGEIARLHIEMSVRRNLYLIYKEAINNAVKYSQCKHIRITLAISENNFVMEITDDGAGFDINKKHLGNGLVNMQRRSNEINSKLKIISNKKTGTELKLIFPLVTPS